MLNSQQIKWAMQHDWFVACQDDGQIIVVERWSDSSGHSGSEFILWTQTFRALRLWAGY
jgi:hypothetical protein